MSEIGRQLVEMEREEKRCVEDANRHRDALIHLSHFGDSAGLARLACADAAVRLERALLDLQLCARRAAELQEDRKRLAAT